MQNMILKGKFFGIFVAFIISSAACAQTSKSYVGMTSGRMMTIIFAVVGLFSVITGGLALRTTVGFDRGRGFQNASIVTGIITILASILHLALAKGDFGTGSGRAGAIVALTMGLIGISLGGLAFVRSRRS